ncbi:MAG TPA: NAD-dependent succinate-semialdehyde dehydrogenase [Syntrophobacteraceae bacterium]|nr:NAD-dependent succinate-semialdehyde dehydrogenase [Syntrophobacteraceae bacterium]
MKLKSINPFTGGLNAEFDPLPDEACSEAVLKGKEAFEAWRRLPVSDRVKPLAKLAFILRQNKRELSRVVTVEMGKPIREAVAEIEKCALACDYYHQNAEKLLQGETVESVAAKSYVVFEPLGVILGIMPWNFPFWQVARWAVPTLAAGNVCLLKHASNVPITAIEIEKVFREAGFPEHVFQTLLTGPQGAERLIEQGQIDGVSLTGSVSAGASVGSLAGKNLKKVVLELGGSDPFIVLDDAHLEKAAHAAVKSRMGNAGQSCIAAKRLIVKESVSRAFREKFIEVINSLRIGDPMDESTDMGPVAREEFLETLGEQLDDALKKGALIHRGPKPPEQGFFFQPVILSQLTEDMRVLREEVFGPIAAMVTAPGEEEMIRIANETEFGLGAAIWTRDISKAERLAGEISSGFIAINDIVKSDPRLPFGGIKKSGFGRELSHFGLKEFVNIKTVVVGS